MASAKRRASKSVGSRSAPPFWKLTPRNGAPAARSSAPSPIVTSSGAALGRSGEAGEEAVVGDALGGHLDAVVEGGEQGRDEGETGGESDQDDGDAGGAERAEDGELEDEQAAERDRHGEGGERDRAPGGRDGDHHRLLGVAAETALLAIALHHEQGVVDRQAQAEHGRHGWHARVERQEVGEGEQRGEAAGDRAERAQERYARGDEPAEQEHHHEQRDRHGNGFAALGVLLGLLGALALQEQVAAEDHLGASVLAEGAEAFLDGVQRPVFTVGPEVLEVDEEQHGLAVGGDEARFGRGGHGVDHAGDAGDLAQVGGRGCQGVVVAVALDDGGDARAVLRCVGHDVEALKRLDLRAGVVGAQPREDLDSHAQPDDERHQPADEDQSSVVEAEASERGEHGIIVPTCGGR